MFRIFFVAAMFAALPMAHAGLGDMLKGILKDSGVQQPQGDGTAGVGAAALSSEDMVKGVLDALSVGVERAVQLLGKDGGYLNDAAVKIPMPGALSKVESVLRALKQDRYADEFIATMNHAAEQAVPQASSIFANAIKSMQFEDAKAIVQGPDNAATQYFQEHTTGDLTSALLPIVQQATNAAGVTSSYKTLVSKAGVMGSLVNQDSLDLDQYVTDKALSGLFLKLAEEEKRIRQNPVARTTDILKKVFGSMTGG